MTRTLTALPLAALLLVAASRPAAANMDKTFTYRYGVIWSTAIRLLRADKSYKVDDKDKENGYILFTFPGAGSVKECPATMEIFRVVDREGFRRIQVKLRIAHQPSYIELHLLEQLEKKLQDEQGDPPPPRRKQKKRPKKPRPPADKGRAPEGGKRP